MVYTSYLTSCQTTQDLRSQDLRKHQESLKTYSIYELVQSLPAKMKNSLILTKKSLEKQKLNSSRIALFHMKTRVCLKFFVNDCRTCHHLICNGNHDNDFDKLRKGKFLLMAFLCFYFHDLSLCLRLLVACFSRMWRLHELVAGYDQTIFYISTIRCFQFFRLILYFQKQEDQGFLKGAIESRSNRDLNPRPLNSVQTLQPTELSAMSSTGTQNFEKPRVIVNYREVTGGFFVVIISNFLKMLLA